MNLAKNFIGATFWLPAQEMVALVWHDDLGDWVLFNEAMETF